MLLEKLLRSCPEVRSVYVLVRSKAGQSPKARISEIVNSKVSNGQREDGVMWWMVLRLFCSWQMEQKWRTNVILHIFATSTMNTLWMDYLCTFAKSSSFSFCSSLVFFSPLTSSLPQFGDCSGLRVPKFVLGHLQSLSGVQIRLWDRSFIILVSANFAEWQAATCWWSSFW